MTEAQIKIMLKASAINRVVKEMGGLLKVESSFIETSFTLSVPCKKD
jgi:hypothetical protein